MDRFAAMQAFVAVVETGSFVRAGERLGLSATSVSRAVAALEAHLDVRLLYRTTRRVSLTDAGRTYYRYAVDLLADLAEAEAAVSADSRTASGVLRLSVPVTFGVLHLAPLLPRFRQQHPGLTLDLSLDDRITDLVEEGRDLAVRISRELLATTLVARPLTSTQLVVCAAPSYLARFGAPQSPEELGRHQCLLYSYADQAGQWAFRAPDGSVHHVAVKGVMIANNGDVLRLAALAGEGIVVQPSFIVGDDLLSGRLVPLLQDYALPPLKVYAVYPGRRHLPAKVRLFIEFLKAAWGEPPPWERWRQRQD
ncbi:MAG: LysR family transcriptional regulator [Xanthomonadaceae bacterium]|nr:LysR family transcriptional regulator [Xanthomonadaceae bacterium]